MPQSFVSACWRNRATLAALLAVAVAATGCSGSSFGLPTTPAATAAAPPPAPAPGDKPVAPAAGVAAAPSSSSSWKDKIENFFSSKSATAPQPVANAPQPDVDCPYIDIRQGAATLTIPPPPPDGSNEAMTLKYQGTFVRAARDCKVVAGQMVMNVGVQGRIIVGPAGGPGEVNVPLRIAVVSAPTAGSKLIVTKLVQVPVNVPNEDGASFTHIEEGLTFPMPSAAELSTYIVYIGFDPIGAAALDHERKPTPKPRLKPKGRVNPSTPTG